MSTTIEITERELMLLKRAPKALAYDYFINKVEIARQLQTAAQTGGTE